MSARQCPTEADIPAGPAGIYWSVDHKDYHRECIAWWTCRLCEPTVLRFGRGPLEALPAMEANADRHLAEKHA